MKLTERGLHVIKQWERFRAKAYMDGFRPDGSKILSIGFGHSNLLDEPKFDENSVWTEEYASEVLRADLERFGDELKPHLKIEVPDEIWSICLSLAYNKGSKGLYTSDQWKILHDTETDKYNLERFCQSILDYRVNAVNKETGKMEFKKGLYWRRIAEAGLFLQDRVKGYA